MTRLALILAAVLGLAACETIKGAGQDLQSAGQTIESEAAESQANM
ncbi:MAG TPA: entericidin A/B family lipoprotein [Albidovulum sp.]|nr:entericidin A/B family lipoprotein [Albidovulum sp.]